MTSSRASIPLGDLHHGKRAMLFSDQHGDPIIYKPRDAATERTWKDFLCALRCAGLVDLPGWVEVLSEDEGGHREAVVQHLPTTREALPGYYRRCGTLLFFAWLFGATDLHGENLIACGDVPVPVDLETLFSGVEARTSDMLLESLAWSVYRSHLLPQFDGRTDISGFTGTNAEGKNLPFVAETADKQGLSLQEMAEAICAGFETAFHFAEAHRPLLETEIRRFGKCRFRVILRPTDTYGKMIQLLNALPEAQRERYAHALILPAYQRDRDPERVQKARGAIREEAAALLRGDIPLFTVSGDGLDLLCRNECVLKDYLRLSPVDFALGRLAGLSAPELEKQTALIRTAYDALRPLPVSEDTETASEPIFPALAEELARCRIPHHPGAYIRLAADSSGKGYFQSAGWGLYDGLSGILCAYGALYRKTGAPEVLERLLELYGPMPAALSIRGIGPMPKHLVSLLASERSQSYEKNPPASFLALTDTVCALGDGLGGILAALLHLAELTGLKLFRADALALAGRLDPSRCKLNSTDLLNGTGGLALQLPKLPESVARPLAEALLPLFLETEPTLTGLAHGAAGQALCLGALQTVLPERDLRAPIVKLLRWEDALFDEAAGNWPDLRRGSKRDFMGGWCAGAPGVGLARQRLAEYVTDPEITAICRADQARSLAWLDRAGFARRDGLCCGSAARLMAASRLGGETGRWVRRLAGTNTADSPRLYHMLDTADHNAGLMQGLGGVIYALAMTGDPGIGGMLL